MLNYQSVRSSEPQIRSNPALRHISEKSGFQKRLSTLLEPTPIPFPTFQLVKESSASFFETQQCYGWTRPSHLRAQWLVLADGMPTMLLDPKKSDRLYSLRVPFDKKRVQQIGPIVCEAAWDAQDHILWIWDVLVWEKEIVWSHMPYSKRWELVKDVIGKILDCGHPMSDAEVRVPTWQSLAELEEIESLDPAYSIEFQPEKAGQRRHLYLVRDDGVKFKATSHHERKMVAEHDVSSVQKKTIPSSVKYIPCAFVPDDFPDLPVAPVVVAPVAAPVVAPVPVAAPVVVKHKQEEFTVARLRKDTHSKIPDTYCLETATGEPLGLAAIRTLEMSKRLRELLKKAESIFVDVQWYEPFQKYSVLKILNNS